MAKDRLELYDKYGNKRDVDISSEDVTLDNENGKSLKTKLNEFTDAIAAAIKSVTFNGNSPSPDASGNVNLGQQIQADWDENNPEWPSYIRNKPSLANVATSGDYNDLRNKPTIPEGAQTDSQMSDTSEAPVQNKVIKAYVDAVSQRIDTLIGSGNVQGAIDTFNEVVAFLNGINSSETLAAKLLLKADKSTTYTKTETDNAIADAVEGLGGGSVESVSVNGGEPQLPDQNGNIDIKSVDGITPHIDVVTGHWFIGDEDTGIDAHGLQGNSGYTGAVGELEVVEDYTEGGVGKAASAEAVKEMAIKSIPESGSFADAYDKARANNVVFPWFLRDVDENGNPIEKMIWHNGYRKFVDAIGAEVEGQKNGLTIWVNTACELYFKRGANDESYYPLAVGENNFSFNDLEWDGSTAIAKDCFNVVVREGGTTTSHGNYVDKIDFGGWKLVSKSLLFYNWDSLTKVKRLCVQINIDSISLLENCNELVEAQIEGTAGTTGAYAIPMLSSCPKLERADLKDLSIVVKDVQVTSSLTKTANLYGILSDCPLLEYADIRGIDTAQVDTFGTNFFKNDTSLRTLVIGNFSNENMASKSADMFLGVTDCVLICTASEPPVLKNCAFDNDVAQDEYDSALDWVAGHFSAIYVPTNAVTAYKSNVYVTGGIPGNTGWSKYADIIHDIAGTEYEDLII